MNKYVQVSYEMYEMFEKAVKKAKEYEITFLDNKGEVTLNSKIVDLRSVSNKEFIEIEDGTVIRLDKVLAFNGQNTNTLNQY